jgi:hypothetical protein
MFKSVFRSCTCVQCSHGSKKKDKRLSHRYFRRIHKIRLKNGDYEVKRFGGYEWYKSL